MRELRRGVTGAIREAAGPLVERDVKKLTQLADKLSGHEYHTVAPPRIWPVMEQSAGHPFLLNQEDGEWRAYSAVCPSCKQHLHFLSYAAELKCFACDQNYRLGEDTRLALLPVRRANALLQVGLPAREAF
ncbi:hypothetical protein [Paenibacillus sp. YN15]|uniref:hypothetical protein n=1 Tax=Paenibacillus sp. YN15 TaxID=1742774 RepID=UPI0015EB7B19|nr:hypothetical protein [Paenibacillus sp. YN15]